MRVTKWVSGMALILIVAAQAWGEDFKTLRGRIPGEANAIVIVDLEKMLKSPIAVREKWQQQMANAYDEGPLVVPPGTARLIMAALLDPQTRNSAWEVSVMDIANPPTIEAIAQADGGYVEKVGDKPAAWSPVNAYFLQLDKNVLGVVAPANRQFAARWARQKQTLSGAFASSYLYQAQTMAEQGSDVVLAMDMEDMVSARRLYGNLNDLPLDSLQNTKVDLKALATLMETIKGLTLQIDVADSISGCGEIEFGSNPSLIATVAKPLLLEVLGRTGMYVADFEHWNVTLAGNKVKAEGPLTTEGLRRLLSVVQPPAPVTAAAMAETPTAAGKTESVQLAKSEEPAHPERTGADTPAMASQKYFRAVSKILDNLSKNVGGKGASLADITTWAQRDAGRIQKLPILNVDPELLDWANTVSARLREMGNVFEVARTQIQGATGTIQPSYSTDPWGNVILPANEAERVAADRRQIAQSERARAVERASDLMHDLRGSVGKIRADMTKRYGIEF